MKILYNNVYNILSDYSKNRVDNFSNDIKSNLSSSTDYERRFKLIEKISKRNHLNENSSGGIAWCTFNDVDNKNIVIELNSNPAVSFIFSKKINDIFYESIFAYDILDDLFSYHYIVQKNKNLNQDLIYLSINSEYPDEYIFEINDSAKEYFSNSILSEVRDVFSNINFLNSVVTHYTTPALIKDIILLQHDITLSQNPVFSGVFDGAVLYNDLFKTNKIINKL